MSCTETAESKDTESQSHDNWETMLLLASKVRADSHANRSVVKHLEKHTREELDAWIIQTLKLKVNKHARFLKGEAMTAMFHITASLRGLVFVDQGHTGISVEMSAVGP